ncbi:MAG: hypothetical protein LC687_06810, partial [Actinobacteria bacterium]|nr:hypothetical protein [Actinomycetota bacterium]
MPHDNFVPEPITFDDLSRVEVASTAWVQPSRTSLIQSDISNMMNSHTHNYNSFAGVDIIAQVVLPGEEPMTLGELQTISYSMHREN